MMTHYLKGYFLYIAQEYGIVELYILENNNHLRHLKDHARSNII